jgi:hypothetical protein
VVTLHTDADTEDRLADTLVHEAAHQLVGRRIYGEDHRPSRWVSEGLASYFGYTYMDDESRFRPGQIGGKEVALFRKKAKASRESRDVLVRYRRAVRSLERKMGPIPVSKVVDVVDPADFYGEHYRVHYFFSWLLVHFLFHGDDGGHAGQGGADVFFRELGLSRDELDLALAEHLKKLKAR